MSDPFEPESDSELEPDDSFRHEGEGDLEATSETEIESASATETDEHSLADKSPTPAPDTDSESESETDAVPAPAPKLERLQKILAQAGVASRRHAEQLIAEGRVQVNGQVVTTLGSKADPARDHIRVDGKLLHGAERLRYFMLNKPRGFVTTVSDPEGRPTVMQFFDKTRERVFPVGRLDYESEGLLLMTNDGELANKLTRAASGVEKTYLVKVSGQPAEEELERLREGVRIDRAGPGEGKVHTAPAQIRRVRQGDNPWFEVVLIEGRNRELRKMFQEIGHYVEKIRRVGYGPLVLDVEPGEARELDAQELDALRRAAEGRRKPAKPFRAKEHSDPPRGRDDARKRPPAKPFRDDSGSGRSFTKRAAPPFGERAGKPREDRLNAGRPRVFGDRPSGRPPRTGQSGPDRTRDDRPRSDRPGPDRFRPDRSRPDGTRDDRRGFSQRPAHRDKRDDRKSFEPRSAPPFREREGRPRSDRPNAGRPRTFGDRPSERPARPAWRDERREPSGSRQPREANRERFAGGERRERSAKSGPPRSAGFDRRPASDRPRSTERSRGPARDQGDSGFSRREPGGEFRGRSGKPGGKTGKPDSRPRPQARFAADKRSSGTRPQKTNRPGGGSKSRRPFPPR